MNNIHPGEMVLATRRDVITLGDYEMCPTVKSDKEIDTIIVVKPDGNLQPIQAGRDHGSDNRYKSLENRAVGGAAQ